MIRYLLNVDGTNYIITAKGKRKARKIAFKIVSQYHGEYMQNICKLYTLKKVKKLPTSKEFVLNKIK